MADYWMKLYMEILDDSKMATLPDRLWRRTIELFLLAKRYGKNGELPEARQIAWMLRMDTDELSMDLQQIEATGIIQPIAGGWVVVNFAKRQASVSDAERKRQQRERDHKQRYYNPADVTGASRGVTQSTDAESDTESESDAEVDSKQPFSLLLSAYYEEMGPVPFKSPAPRDVDALDRMVRDGIEPRHIKKAIQEMRDKKLHIVGPASLENPARIVANRDGQSAQANAKYLVDTRMEIKNG
jgi:hypothetical protein